MRIYEYFEYKWDYDRNQAIDDEDEIAILTQLPDHVQDRVQGFLFNDFLTNF